MAAFVDFQDSSKGIENHGFYAGHGYSYLSVRDNLIFAELPGLFYNAKPKSLKSSLLSKDLHDPFLTIGAQRAEPQQQFGFIVPDSIKVRSRQAERLRDPLDQLNVGDAFSELVAIHPGAGRGRLQAYT